MTHLSDEDLILLFYSEPDAAKGGRRHLDECPECRAAAESLTCALSVFNELPVPERGPEFGRDTWNRLIVSMDSEPQAEHGLHRFLRSRALQAAFAGTGFAVLLLAVFLAGRFSRPAVPPVVAGLSDHAQERVVAIAVADHLDRVQILMTEIANGRGANLETLASERERAEDLVQEGRLMRQSLATRGETATTSFLGEVETFLTEAAHTPDREASYDLELLRNRIKAGSLLFKVRIVESNLRETAGNKEQKL